MVMKKAANATTFQIQVKGEIFLLNNLFGSLVFLKSNLVGSVQFEPGQHDQSFTLTLIPFPLVALSPGVLFRAEALLLECYLVMT